MDTQHLATEVSALNICAFILDMRSNTVPSNNSGVTGSMPTAGGMVIFLYNIFVVLNLMVLLQSK